jgi:hypothetical protein
MENIENKDANIDDLYDHLVRRFRAVSKLFRKLGSEEAVHQLLNSLVLRDSEAFNRLIGAVDIPDLPPNLKCRLIQEWVEEATCDPYIVEICRLRLDLTPDERLQYLLIAFRHRPSPPVVANTGIGITLLGENPEIPPGPFLDELKANNLVTCNDETRYDCKLQLVFGPPEWVCV